MGFFLKDSIILKADLVVIANYLRRQILWPSQLVEELVTPP
jgi:hypothetical protein